MMGLETEVYNDRYWHSGTWSGVLGPKVLGTPRDSEAANIEQRGISSDFLNMLRSEGIGGVGKDKLLITA